MSAAALRVLESSSADMVSNLPLAKQDALRQSLRESRLTVVPASRLGVRPRPLTISTGIPGLDALTGGLPRGALTEVVGVVSSGRSSVLLSILAAATARKEVCALVDTDDAFDPQSAVAAGVDLKRVLWIRCWGGLKVSRRALSVGSAQTARTSQRENRKFAFRRIEQALKSADLLLQSGGFGVIVIDLADVPPRSASRIPLASWFRFRRAVENTPAVLLVLEQEPFAKSCASLVLKLENRDTQRAPGLQAVKQHAIGDWKSATQSAATPAHSNLLAGLTVSAEVTHDRAERKPVRSAIASFDPKAAWAG